LTHYKGVNYRKLDEFKNLNTDNNTFGDILYKGAYFGGTIDPYEAVFVKTNRNLDLSLPEPSNLKYFGKKMILILIFLSLFFLFKKIKLDKFFKVKIKSG
jgi:hypothetical protein